MKKWIWMYFVKYSVNTNNHYTQQGRSVLPSDKGGRNNTNMCHKGQKANRMWAIKPLGNKPSCLNRLNADTLLKWSEEWRQKICLYHLGSTILYTKYKLHTFFFSNKILILFLDDDKNIHFYSWMCPCSQPLGITREFLSTLLGFLELHWAPSWASSRGGCGGERDQ